MILGRYLGKQAIGFLLVFLDLFELIESLIDAEIPEEEFTEYQEHGDGNYNYGYKLNQR